MRWRRGLPFKSLPVLLRLFLIAVETILTPFLLPLIGYTFYRDQKRNLRRPSARSGEMNRSKGIIGRRASAFLPLSS